MTRALFVAIICALTVSPVLASQGEQQLSVKALYAHPDQSAGGAAIEYCYHLSDLWKVGAEGGWIGGDPNESRPYFGISAGIQLDAISWVPYLQLATSLHMGEGDPMGTGWLIGVEAGADYRPSRTLSIGLWTGYHQVISAQDARNMPSFFAAGIKVSTFF
ncbi:MAG TPA: hypothetical protein EYN06_06420 [Myxococcales bacterium]|nr:hypothetical protein [Myxococcales bacterium]HIN86098.1 hypothetical protein [Myxococcales bacterium]